MNARRKIVYTAVGFILILVAVLFTVISIVSFNSQNASAAPGYSPGMDEVAIKIKVNYPPTFSEPKKREETTKESIKIQLENAIEDNTNLRVVTSWEEKHRPEWMVYYLINQEHDGTKNRTLFVPEGTDLSNLINQAHGTAGMSITLTHEDRFVMNHIKAIHIDDSGDLRPFIDDMIEVVLKVIQQKMKNKNASIIVTDKSTIAN